MSPLPSNPVTMNRSQAQAAGWTGGEPDADGNIIIKGSRRPDGSYRPDIKVRAGWVGDLDRVKYVNPIQERRARNGPVGAQIAEDAAAAVPPPKPKKEARKSTSEEALHVVAAGGGEGNKCGKPKPGSTAAAAGNSGADAVGDADGACSGLSDIEKQLRTLRKKLRQIEIIESKDAPTQEELDKAAKKAEILAALAKLQV